MFAHTHKKKTLADPPPTLQHIYFQLKRQNYVIRKLLSKLNPNAIAIETCRNGWKLRKVVMYPTKTEIFIPQDLLNICGFIINGISVAVKKSVI